MAVNGREFFLVEVIAITLKYLKDLLMGEVHRGGHIDLKVSNFLWVVTVPAIWGARGKQIMREAAYLVREKVVHIELHYYHSLLYRLDYALMIILALRTSLQHFGIFQHQWRGIPRE